jgi:hypothetical protein
VGCGHVFLSLNSHQNVNRRNVENKKPPVFAGGF